MDSLLASMGVDTRRKLPRGWDICVEWHDGTTSWVPLKDVKQSNPLEMADYAVSNDLAEQPASNWWVHNIL